MRRATTIVAVALMLAACTTSADSDETTTTSGGATNGGTETTTTTTAAITTTTSPDTTTTAAAPSDGLADCVVGVWELDSQKFFDDLLAAMPPDEVVGEFLLIDGAYLLTVGADGTVVNERSDWTFGVDSDFGQLELRINSRQTGTYTIDGDTISVSMDPAPAPEVTILVDGTPVDFPGGALPIEPPETDFTGTSIACNGDTLIATTDELSSTWDRIG
jgi:hypothetical protein